MPIAVGTFVPLLILPVFILCYFTSFLHTSPLCGRLLVSHGIQNQLLTLQTKQQVSEQAWLTHYI
jgi:uncharacterized membrane protein YbaN (DUF454 family)